MRYVSIKIILYLLSFFFFAISVPPHQILVYDASGRDVSGAVGPLYEGDSLVLSCEVRGGKFKFVPFILITNQHCNDFSHN